MAVLYDGTDFNKAEWLAELEKYRDEIDLRIAPDIGRIEDVTYVIVGGFGFRPLGAYPNLKGVLSQWAGVNHILADATLSPDIPIVRMSDVGLVSGMREYVVYHALRRHLDAARYEAQQKAGIWREWTGPMASERTVGVMGLGQLGAAVATGLHAVGFNVRGWSRTGHAPDGVTAFAGEDQLAGFLGETEILVCLLPLTRATRGILNARTFSRLPKGAYLIHVARGDHLVEADLAAALDTGQIGGATIDVFPVEPVPAGHRFWTDENVIVTPHVASISRPWTGVPFMIEAWRTLEAGERPITTVDRHVGY